MASNQTGSPNQTPSGRDNVRYRSLFGKRFRSPKPRGQDDPEAVINNKDVQLSNPVEVQVVLPSSPPISITDRLNTENDSIASPLDGPPHQEGKTPRRLQAEKAFKDASATLEKAMSKISVQLQVPEALGLQHLTKVSNVERTTKQLETAIDKILDARRLNATVEGRAKWKACITRWFKAVFPYIQPCLEAVGVSQHLHSLFLRLTQFPESCS